MNEHPGRHLSEEQLLGFLDHELSRREFGGAREHLRICWKCQTELTELRETIGEFVRYQQRASQAEASMSPSDWPDLRQRMREFERVEGERRRVPGPGLRWGWLARSVAATAVISTFAVAAIVFVRYESHEITPVSVPSRTEAAAPAPASSAPASLIPPSRPTAAIPPLHVESASGLRAEVGALVTLHELEADLGEPIRVEKRPGGKVQVTGNGLSQDREVEIATALRARPEIAVRFEQPGSVSAAPATASRVRSVSQSNAALTAALEPVFGGRSEVEAFANSVVDESDEMMARAYALNNLAQHFPVESRSQLNEAERQALSRIETDHRQKLTVHARRVGQLVATLRKAGADNPSEVPHASVFESARRLDRAVSRTFGGEANSTPLPQLFSELLAASRQLDTALSDHP